MKFYGWENRWIDRVLAARNYELVWLVKRMSVGSTFMASCAHSLSGQINQVMFSSLWRTAHILISVVSFLTYVMTGHELTISVAFTVNELDPLGAFFYTDVSARRLHCSTCCGMFWPVYV